MIRPLILVADFFLLIEKCLYSQDHKASMRPALESEPEKNETLFRIFTEIQKNK